MSFDADEEILQDFLVEAGEILEQLSEQLVTLEQESDNIDLLNAIFRGFHTVKGGAGFLQLDALVEISHVTENVFDILRNRKREVTPELMDVVLSALDTVHEMFGQVQNREAPTPANPELLKALEAFSKPQEAGESASPAAAEAEAATATEASPTDSQEANPEAALEAFVEELADDGFSASSGDDDLFGMDDSDSQSSSDDEITEEEFEAMLNQMDKSGGEQETSSAGTGSASSAASSASNGSDEITDDEFEALLDNLHGKGKFDPSKVNASEAEPNASAGSDSAQGAQGNKASGSAAGQSPVDANGDLISDDEFEALLDELHGKGKGPSANDSKADSKASSASPAAEPDKASVSTTPAPEPVAKKQPDSPEVAKAGVPKPAAAPRNAGKDTAAVQTETTVRVDTKRLDDIMNMVGELVLVRNRLVRLGLSSTDEAMAKAVANLDVVTADLQMAVMKTRMQPIKKVFGRFPRVVRDLARNLKKEVNLELVGEDTDLDKNLVEALADPLVHLVRNSVDHGIEMPDVREKMGKPRAGKVVLAAQQEGDHIVLSITDDGAGMDPNLLRKKAVEKGLMDEDSAERLTDHEAFNLIFHAGFSTKEQVSDVSGRGVGMDVVKTKIGQLNGTITIDSVKGKGSQIAIKVPLTLAIMPTLMVMLGDQTFALPLVNVNEIFHLNLEDTNIVDGQEVIVVRDKALPLFHLKKWLVSNDETTENQMGHVVVVSVGTQRVGFVVDQLIGQEEVVIKPLGTLLHGTPGLAGATITGDGRIALILDVPSMLKRYT